MLIILFKDISETSLKTVDFGLKPGNCLVFNCPDLKVGAIHVRDILGFSQLLLTFDAFLDPSQIILPIEDFLNFLEFKIGEKFRYLHPIFEFKFLPEARFPRVNGFGRSFEKLGNFDI